MKIQIFLQSELLRDIEVVEVEADIGHAKLHEICLLKLGDRRDEIFHLFIEDEEDAMIESMGHFPDGLRLHIHRHKAIDVAVRYAGREVHHTFKPGTTIARVKRWATQEIGIAASDAAELMLQIHGTDVRPDADIHIGSLVEAPKQRIVFDLVPSPRVNG